ncbi:MAG: biotin--[acetyl-CoA-carboxylase] ligase [Bacteroidales bacterium]|nr:biotin--[acetyl-CoA-carboxylase] ligase [Clostridium sp.]MCM1204578.1 biotin--[acetyl-CoA-carboxylase] ligase [Bacteroidales bacterium]
MKEKIVEILKAKSDYVSGQEICNMLGVSRTAVWKNINALKAEGYRIDSVNNKGYKLLGEPDIINEMRVREHLHTKWLAGMILYEEEMDSTNIQAKRLGESNAPNGALIVTERQTAGRGRRGKTWVSPQGNCYFSILLRPEIMMDRASMITLVSALALAKAIKQTTNLDTMIKWPNDVIANGKKLCGILTESSTDLEYINYAVVGIGINTNQIDFPEEIRETASSIRLETGERVDRAKLLGVFLNIFEQYYEKFLETEDLSTLSAEYNRLLVNCGREVKIIEKEQERILKAVGIDDNGRLIVEDGHGQQEAIISGEVSVRGLYGYV